MSRPSQVSEKSSRRFPRWRRWLIPAALVALIPKCLFCVLAWAGLGAALGLRGVELCGARDESHKNWFFWITVLAAGGVVGWIVRRFANHAQPR